jgi:hypothetical protein
MTSNKQAFSLRFYQHKKSGDENKFITGFFASQHLYQKIYRLGR